MKKTKKVVVLSTEGNPKWKFGEVLELPDDSTTDKLLSEGKVEEKKEKEAVSFSSKWSKLN